MNITKNQQFLLFILTHRWPSTITEIVKLSYLIDLASLSEFKNKISDYKYIRYFYWPYAVKIQSDLEKLAFSNYIIIEAKTNPQWYENILYSINPEKELWLNLNDEEKNFTLEVLKDLGGYRAWTLTQIAYKTKPMLDLGATLWWNEHLNELLI
jgi:hypothetical protein